MTKQKTELQRRAFNFEIRAEESERGHIITGRPIVYNSRTDMGYFDEIIAPGALDRTDLTDVRFLVNHNLSMIPLARSRRNNGNSTMLLSPDADGLGIRVDMDTENNADARALYSAVERGDISGMSFMFGIRGEEWEDLDSDHPLHIITDISTVVEVSAVTFPAFESTAIDARSDEALEKAKTTLENARQARAKALESAGTLELEKEKLKILGG